MSVPYGKLTVGAKVRIPEFEATVVALNGHGTDVYGCTEVRSSSGWTHFIFREDMELVDPPLPYEDGKKYRDADGDELTFTATGWYDGPGWITEGGGKRGYSYATRPLRAVLSKPSYGPEITE